MRAGEMDRKIVIQRRVVERSTAGQAKEVWNTFAIPWARVVPGSGGESFGSDQRSATQTVVLECYWLSGVDPTMRIQYQGQEYDIRDVQEIGRREGLRIVAEVREQKSGGV